jgi:hypothetical protein
VSSAARQQQRAGVAGVARLVPAFGAIQLDVDGGALVELLPGEAWQALSRGASPPYELAYDCV